MMRKLSLALVAVVVMGLALPVAADLCTIDAVPAATLLLPYFEVDTVSPTGVTTLFSVNNASATAVLAHVTIWSDLSVPVLDFDIYLTGYDVQTINLRDIIVNGVIPRTASDGQDPTDTISPQGPISQDINFASCTGFLPPPPTIGSAYITHLINALTGKGSTLETGAARCYGVDYGDGIARGYVTVDTVTGCSLFYPNDAARYWTGYASFQNVLWGDFFYVNPGQNFAQGDTLVHIEAAPGAPYGQAYDGFPVYNSFLAGDYTFYGRYVAFSAVDQREPLPSVYAARYADGGAFSGGTDLTVWRDSKVNQSPFSCPAVAGTRPSWYPLPTDQIVVFDEEENPIVADTCPVSPCGPNETVTIPAEAQRVVMGVDIPVESSFGWVYLNLNFTNASGPLAQAWVGMNMDAEGRFSVGLQGIALNELCSGAVPSLLPIQ